MIMMYTLPFPFCSLPIGLSGYVERLRTKHIARPPELNTRTTKFCLYYSTSAYYVCRSTYTYTTADVMSRTTSKPEVIFVNSHSLRYCSASNNAIIQED